MLVVVNMSAQRGGATKGVVSDSRERVGCVLDVIVSGGSQYCDTTGRLSWKVTKRGISVVNPIFWFEVDAGWRIQILAYPANSTKVAACTKNAS